MLEAMVGNSIVILAYWTVVLVVTCPDTTEAPGVKLKVYNAYLVVPLLVIEVEKLLRVYGETVKYATE